MADAKVSLQSYCHHDKGWEVDHASVEHHVALAEKVLWDAKVMVFDEECARNENQTGAEVDDGEHQYKEGRHLQW